MSAAVIFPAIAILFKASSLRGDLHEKWHTRSNLCAAALGELANHKIEILRDEAIRMLGEADSPFNPARSLSDPEQLRTCVTEFQTALEYRTNLKKWLTMMLIFAGIAPWAMLSYITGAAATTAYFMNISKQAFILYIGISLVSLGFIMGAILAIVHFYCDRKLSSAEIFSNQGGA
ncbi:hypothetical protein [Mycobacteroides immunogenum]|uniref:hypothetical protein n=1 Tax=Mycobacteroides immunogenum TaxID=83262 RepID=UPI001038C3B6|nr:hypothetical protein [Mycobacteroides immunogenum]MCV7306806.1 hypothetical protein [Mycobacteroides immunogenum]